MRKTKQRHQNTTVKNGTTPTDNRYLVLFTFIARLTYCTVGRVRFIVRDGLHVNEGATAAGTTVTDLAYISIAKPHMSQENNKTRNTLLFLGLQTL